jgi:RNA polymerase sigma factor (sigma-70 family)
MRRVREGSEDAAWEVIEDQDWRILRTVRRILNPKLRSKYDSFDFTQKVWLSFFRARDKAEYFKTPQQLAKFLVGMARHKVHMEIRERLFTEKRDIDREVPFVDSLGENGRAITGSQPEPDEMAIAHERLERLLQDQPAHYRRIIELKAEEYSCAEIGEILDLDANTVRRFLNKLFFAAEA